MATLAEQPFVPSVGDERFFLRAAVVMTVIIVAGFSFQLAMGRSTFASPIRVHIHAVLFMGWVWIYLFQNIFVATSCTASSAGWQRRGWWAWSSRASS